MISHQYRTIFIHQRKCAGVSIIDSFGLRTEDPEWHLFNEGSRSPEWRTRSDREREYFVFSSVRNPFDRVISAWRYLEATRDRPLEEVLGDPPRDGHDYRHFTRPQVEILRVPGSPNLIVDDVIRFESLQPDYDRVSRRLGKPHCSLRHLNRTTRDPGYRSYFTTTARSLVESLFQEDLDTFNYQF